MQLTNKKKLVLEIGSGHNPLPRSDILCDQYLLDNRQRSNFNIRFDRPLVIANGEKLPFRNKAFDYVICNQVVEHAHNLSKFIQEIQRVGKAGLIIVPHVLRERLFGWPAHRWFIFDDKNKLIFTPKGKCKSHFGNFYHHLYQKEVYFRHFCLLNEKKFNIYYKWKDKINFEIKRTINLTGFDKELKYKLTLLPKTHIDDLKFNINDYRERFKRKIIKTKRKLIWDYRNWLKPHLNLEILKKYLICPNCHKSLIFILKYLECSNCRKKYEIIKGIPILK
jgi:SAM-dependent methyltransferase